MLVGHGRLGQRKPAAGERLSDHICIGVLTRTFPPELVDRIIEATGKREQRVRLLPARVTLYFVLALCLFTRESYTEVATLLVKGWCGQELGCGRGPSRRTLRWSTRGAGWGPSRWPSCSARSPDRWRRWRRRGVVSRLASGRDRRHYLGRSSAVRVEL
jgi:hypothetical protein